MESDKVERLMGEVKELKVPRLPGAAPLPTLSL